MGRGEDESCPGREGSKGEGDGRVSEMGGAWESIAAAGWGQGSKGVGFNSEGRRRQIGNVGWDKDIEGLKYQTEKFGLCLLSLGSGTSGFISLPGPPAQSTTERAA